MAQSTNCAGRQRETRKLFIERYKSVTAEMYSNKLGVAGRGRAGVGRTSHHRGHDIGSLLNNLYHDKSSTKINIEMKLLSGQRCGKRERGLRRALSPGRRASRKHGGRETSPPQPGGCACFLKLKNPYIKTVTMKFQRSERRGRDHAGLPGLVPGSGGCGIGCSESPGRPPARPPRGAPGWGAAQGQRWAASGQLEKPGAGGGPTPTHTPRQLCPREAYSIK